MASSHSWICALLMALCLASSAAGWRRELTTRSWDVLGFHENLPHSPYEDQIIIGVIDSGIWPESPSFDDEGLGPPPAKWKGVCQVGHSSVRPFKCNNKVIGARVYYLPPEDYKEYFPHEDLSPRDTSGHGTHVAAIVAGVAVKNVSMEGVGMGTARGAVPRARIAVYKACWGGAGCQFSAFAIIDAISDGVDIISMSIGTLPVPFEVDMVSYASFPAMKHGIFLASSAGNNITGIHPYLVNNVMPWVTTVGNSAGAGTDYVTYVRSGDGKKFKGAKIHLGNHGNTMYPLVMIDDATNATDPELVGSCVPEYMIPEVVKGKIVLCHHVPDKNKLLNGKLLDSLGTAGLLVATEGEEDYNFYKEGFRRTGFKTPVVYLRNADFNYLVKYHLDSKKTCHTATASIAKTVATPDTPPRIAVTSCRGPNLMDLNILKPDISAPGVNLIAAVPGDSLYDAKSGTSMSTPFLTSIAAYVKSFHPTWSPAAIKSALMTTASPMSDPYRNASELAYGTGQVDPLRATDPGLVYDAGEKDYVKYLCQWGNSSNELLYKVIGNNTKDDCTKIPIEKNWQLNYPSFAVPCFTDKPFVKVFQRTVTNVGNSSASNYKAVVSAPEGLRVKVEPSVLAFTQVGQSLSYTLTVEGVLPKRNVSAQVLTAYLVWTDGSHQVKSPIVVFERPVDIIAAWEEAFGVPWEVLYS